MKFYAHYDDAGAAPAHTEALELEGDSDVSFELLRVMFVDAYNAKRAPARLDPYALPLVTDELGGARYPLGGSIFDSLNEGDDVFFSSGGADPPMTPREPAAAAAAAMPLEFQVAALKDEIKRATDDGEYDKLAPLAQEIKELEAQQQAADAQRVRAAAMAAAPAEPANPIEASKATAGEHSHYYWDRQAKGAAPPKPQRVVVPPAPSAASKVEPSRKIERERTIAKFALSDEGAWVRLYINHDGVGALPAGCVTCEFRERSFDFRIDEGLVPQAEGAEGDAAVCYRLHSPILTECVEPGRCKLKVKPNQIVLGLRKLNDGHAWQELHKIKGIGETGRIEPDYGETTTLSS